MSAAAKRAGNPRWLTSFADLCLLLLGFFVILHAQGGDTRGVANGLREAFGEAAASPMSRADYDARTLFQPGEAVLLPAREAELVVLGRRAGQQRIRVASSGRDSSARRFDAWELAAARVAAVARALKQGGADESRIEISIPTMAGADTGKGQKIAITIG